MRHGTRRAGSRSGASPGQGISDLSEAMRGRRHPPGLFRLEIPQRFAEAGVEEVVRLVDEVAQVSRGVGGPGGPGRVQCAQDGADDEPRSQVDVRVGAGLLGDQPGKLLTVASLAARGVGGERRLAGKERYALGEPLDGPRRARRRLERLGEESREATRRARVLVACWRPQRRARPRPGTRPPPCSRSTRRRSRPRPPPRRRSTRPSSARSPARRRAALLYRRLPGASVPSCAREGPAGRSQENRNAFDFEWTTTSQRLRRKAKGSNPCPTATAPRTPRRVDSNG